MSQTYYFYCTSPESATDEIWSKWVIPEMFARGATGELTPEDAIKEAEAKGKDIFGKWKKRGLV